MRLFLTFLVLLITVPSLGQSEDKITWKDLSDGGKLLDKGWRYTTVDSAQWASSTVDDSGWKSINPAIDIHYLPEIRNAGICWFRLNLSIDSSLLNKTLALVINQIGASELYLNGRLLKTLGRIGDSKSDWKTFNPKGEPVLILFDDAETQVLSIRYFVSPSTPYQNYVGLGNPCLRIRLQETDEAFDNYSSPIVTALTNLIHFGAYLILGILHLFFYIYQKSRKVNLYFAIYAFSFSAVFLGDPLFALVSDSFWLFIIGTLFTTSVAVSETFLVLSIYTLFNLRRDIYFRIICWLCILSIPMTFLFYSWGWTCIYFSVILGGIATTRVSILAIRQRERGAVNVLIIQLFILVLVTIFTIYLIVAAPMQENLMFFNSAMYQVCPAVAFLCQPIFISYLLATEFGQLHHFLKKQLIEVEKLSQKTIAQEQEKQLLLTSQNERLENQVLERTKLIVSQKEEIETQRDNLETTLQELQATQTQLIEKEKTELENELKVERLKKEQASADFKSRTAELEMQALRAQMNPHFIFNSLNSINGFILKNDPEAASDYLTKFSKLIRLILQNSCSTSVPLDKELEALKLYIELELLRFEGQFGYLIQCHNELEVEDIEVPPLIIQPYVENAIWHGLMNKPTEGNLKISLHRENGLLFCEITDDGVGRKVAGELKSKSASKRKSLGMQITAHRLELINNVSKKETIVEVIDLFDGSGMACGTTVLLKIPV